MERPLMPAVDHLKPRHAPYRAPAAYGRANGANGANGASRRQTAASDGSGLGKDPQKEKPFPLGKNGLDLEMVGEFQLNLS